MQHPREFTHRLGRPEQRQFSGEIRTLTDFETFQIDINYDDQRIHIEDFNTGTQTDYEVTVNGSIEATSSGDSTSGGTATGAVAGGSDAYEFTGDVEEIVVNGLLRAEVTQRPAEATFRKLRGLEDSYGPKVDSRIDQSSETLETGVFIYYDGTEIPYRAEIRNEKDVETDIDGERFYFPEGSQ